MIFLPPKIMGAKYFLPQNSWTQKNFYVWKYILLRATALLFLAWFINWLLTQLSHWVTKKILQAYLTKKPSILVNLKKKIGLWFQTPSWYSKYLVPKRFSLTWTQSQKSPTEPKTGQKGPEIKKNIELYFQTKFRILTQQQK